MAQYQRLCVCHLSACLSVSASLPKCELTGGNHLQTFKRYLCTGPASFLTGVPTCHTGRPTYQTGAPTCHTGRPTYQTGVPTCHTGTATCHTVVPTCHRSMLPPLLVERGLPIWSRVGCTVTFGHYPRVCAIDAVASPLWSYLSNLSHVMRWYRNQEKQVCKYTAT